MRGSPNLEARWLALVDHLVRHGAVDGPRFERAVHPLGDAARRFVVTCWERFAEHGVRGALRLVCALRANACRLITFTIPEDVAHLRLEISDVSRRRWGVRLPARVLQESGKVLSASLQKRLAAAGAMRAQLASA